MTKWEIVMRWIWIDRFVEFTSGKSARAIRNLSLAEDLYEAFDRVHVPYRLQNKVVVGYRLWLDFQVRPTCSGIDRP